MNRFIVSIGSNSADCHSQVDDAINHLKLKFENVLVSSVYETPALNGVDPSYLNAVAVAYSSLEINQVNAIMKQWEVECGRTPESKIKGVIPIDLDIVVWNDEIIRPKDFSYSFFIQGYNQLVKLGHVPKL